MFNKGDQNDLVEKEETRITLYKSYQPEQMERSEIEKLVNKVISETGVTSMKDIGNVMKALMPLVKGKADGSVVNQVVRDTLSKMHPTSTPADE